MTFMVKKIVHKVHIDVCRKRTRDNYFVKKYFAVKRANRSIGRPLLLCATIYIKSLQFEEP